MLISFYRQNEKLIRKKQKPQSTRRCCLRIEQKSVKSSLSDFLKKKEKLTVFFEDKYEVQIFELEVSFEVIIV